MVVEASRRGGYARYVDGNNENIDGGNDNADDNNIKVYGDNDNKVAMITLMEKTYERIGRVSYDKSRVLQVTV